MRKIKYKVLVEELKEVKPEIIWCGRPIWCDWAYRLVGPV